MIQVMRILLVEDDQRLAAMLARGLAEDGYKVEQAGTGQEALWHVAEHSYDLVVLDVGLPDVSGIDVCRQLRARGSAVPVLMLSARSGTTDRVTGLDHGADDYVSKPFAFSELEARIRALLRRGAAPREPLLTAGSLQLDPATRRCRRSEISIDLSATETILLELFLRNVDSVLSRTLITDHIWDWASESRSNVVDQYVSYLRRKVDKPFAVEQLVTVRGAGYRLLPVERRLVVSD